jgi:hypothetical protein
LATRNSFRAIQSKPFVVLRLACSDNVVRHMIGPENIYQIKVIQTGSIYCLWRPLLALQVVLLTAAFDSNEGRLEV